ncbi:6,7-dimethyl-8-ribityllumazine synthase [bacterium]|jgi:6,7-dimethyl-8-ribityllumazine synthase|nr:6,7-dimethyl-8-ribityllumazine synthase [bacterium]
MHRFAVVISQFNEEVCQGLLHGTREYLKEKGIHLQPEDLFSAPGAFEIPLIAQSLAETQRFDGVICLGCVIKGDTAHFEFISLGAAVGLMQSTLTTKTPITFGILTTYTDEQALVRSQPNPHNKGREAAAACFEAVQTLKKIEKLKHE